MCSNVEEVTHVCSSIVMVIDVQILFVDTAHDKSNWNIAQFYTRGIPVRTEKY